MRKINFGDLKQTLDIVDNYIVNIEKTVDQELNIASQENHRLSLKLDKLNNELYSNVAKHREEISKLKIQNLGLSISLLIAMLLLAYFNM